MEKEKWWIYQGTQEPHDGIQQRLPEPPKWRRFEGQITEERTIELDPHTEKRLGDIVRGKTFQASEEEIKLVNAALYLRRPLLVTGPPGSGKSSLAYAVAYELKLGKVLRWPITSRSTLEQGLYHYDAIGRLQAANLQKGDLPVPPDIGQFIRFGPLGTVLLPTKIPRVVLIDEIDKSDIDLPNNLLNIFEEGEFEIPELSRLAEAENADTPVRIRLHESEQTALIKRGKVMCHAFPFVVLTSNGERELPPPFLRRCLRLNIEKPSSGKLKDIVNAHFGDLDEEGQQARNELLEKFLRRREKGTLATDQLLNAIYLTTQGVELEAIAKNKEGLIEAVLKYLNPLGTV